MLVVAFTLWNGRPLISVSISSRGVRSREATLDRWERAPIRVNGASRLVRLKGVISMHMLSSRGLSLILIFVGLGRVGRGVLRGVLLVLG